MSELPQQPLTPLEAEPGQFEQMWRRARRRRLRTGVGAGLASVVLLTGATIGAMALAQEGNGDRLTIGPASPSATPTPTLSPSATARPSPTSSPTKEASPSPTAEPSRTAEASPTATPLSSQPEPPAVTGWYYGRLIGPDGAPVARAAVASRNPSGWLDEHDAYSGPDGSFRQRCGYPLLVTAWTLGYDQHEQSPNVAPTWIGGGPSGGDGAPCMSDGSEPVVTRLEAGAVLTGRLWTGEGDPATDARGWPRLDCPWAPGGICGGPIVVDGRYTFVGLPAGPHRLKGDYAEADVQVGHGTTERDWYECPTCAAGRPPG